MATKASERARQPILCKFCHVAIEATCGYMWIAEDGTVGCGENWENSHEPLKTRQSIAARMICDLCVDDDIRAEVEWIAESALAAYAAATIERCAQIAESGANNERYADVEEIAAAIRSMGDEK